MAEYKKWTETDAYNRGERPLSNWNKNDILKAIWDEHLELKCSFYKIGTLPLSILKDKFLKYTNWYCTGKVCNFTNFYALNTDYIKDLTDDDIDKLLADHKESLARKRAEKEAKLKEIEAKKAEKNVETLIKEENDTNTIIEEKEADNKPHLKYYKDFPKEYIGGSDAAALLFAGSSENGLISQWVDFGGDSSYHAYIVEGEAEIGAHYSFVIEFRHWLKIYDDISLVHTFYAEKIKVYRAGCYGCIIQLINPCKNL